MDDSPQLNEKANRMMTEHKIIDGDGHVVEDIATIWKYMPEPYVGRSFSDMRGRSPLGNPSLAYDTFHLAAQSIISTSVPRVSSTPTATRAGKLFLSTQAIQASFMSSLSLMSAR